MQFTIPSQLNAVRQIKSRILAELKKNGFGPKGAFAVRLALDEALVNAIRHGNHCDPAKKVRIQATISPRRAAIVVEDEGRGFDRRQLPDPTAEENLCKCNGRGIYLMESYMSKVVWSHGGRRVRMVKENERR